MPDDLLLDIATDLCTADGIWSAVQSGYRRSAQRASAAPRTPREATLAAIWADALHLPEVGVHDDFYELGGDSLLAITVAFHAGEQGIELSARQIMQQRTIAALDLDAGGPVVDAEQGTVTGGMALTPAQLWWCEAVAPTMARPAVFNHPYYVELRRPVPAGHLAEAVRVVAAHHDALRLRVRRDAGGTWSQDHGDPVPFHSHDLSALPPSEQDTAMESLATTEQLGLDLTDGPLCRVVHFHLGPDRPDRLLVVAHHLVTDAISRGILLGDLQTVCGQLTRGEPVRLPAKTTSYRQWARRLADDATMSRVRDELPFWLDQAATDGGAPPPDLPGGVTTLGEPTTVDVTLSAAETGALHDAARRLRASVRDLLVWAVTRAVVARTGGTECAIATTGHGREDLFDDVDLSRTVGWFQVLYPVCLRLTGDGGPAGIAAQLARVPGNGLGYGVLRYLHPDPEVRRRLADLPAPRIAVNYMGTFGFDEVSQAEELFEVCHAPYGPTEDDTGTWPFDLDVGATVTGGRLRVEVGYGPEVYRPETATALLDDIRTHLLRLIDRRVSPQ
jgi:non-ribosomal peptide synthase protein (TIGR01720 family)